jgi:WS/DGAT/MGAT family acyltransferase
MSRMTWRDFAWYRMDFQKNLMVINSILLFEGQVDMDRLISTIEHRLPNYPRFTQKVGTRFGLPYWVEDQQFDIRKHIELESFDHDVTREELQSYMATMARVPLDSNRPLWHMHVIDRVQGGHAIVFRVHHSITDGLGLVHVLNHLTDDSDTQGKTPSKVGHPLIAQPTPPGVCSYVNKVMRWLKIGFHVGRLSVQPSDERTQLKAPMSGEKKLVWLPPMAMDQVRATSKRVGVTLNDLWVGAVSGALRRYLAERGERVDNKALRASVTFNLREKSNAYQLGNEFGLVAVDLPTNHDDPNVRLSESSRRMTAVKRSQQPRATMVFLSIVAFFPALLQRFALNLFTSKGSAVLTNIEGPSRARYLAGSRLSDLICWVPQTGKIGIGLSFISYAGQIQMALFVDTKLVDDPDRLMELTRDEFEILDKATRIMAEQSGYQGEFANLKSVCAAA